jgi:hypothetical protein
MLGMQSGRECSAGALHIERCAGGGNNQVYIVTCSGETLLAKKYFTHPADGRNRLDSEYRFLQYAHSVGIECVPRPIARDDELHVALYEYVDGRKLAPDEIDDEAVDQAVSFYRQLNMPHARATADLPFASEAAFSIRSILSRAHERVERLAAISPSDPVDREAQGLAGEIQSCWRSIKERVLEEVTREGLDADAELSAAERCISPSDFGFHNALLGKTGKLHFIDFEYAGWDDPAKTYCDFVSQPAVPVSSARGAGLLHEWSECRAGAERMRIRVRLLMPVFRMRWCCIMMNDFLPASAARRRFADDSVDIRSRKRVQLESARRCLQELQRG